ncbi:ribosomal protein L37a [Hamiltosporidium magnivora]|uniref:Ribosomal protein L37a n=1 Tax=Hamiltosporidium magnivora TaxID=148818 RepID=A0A4Q9L8D8_9MICR|nr:ribosomal protein L37a [Hamiltosporidium magnivora]
MVIGITGKYGTRYGSSLRKRIKTYEISQHKKYECSSCGKHTVKRESFGIWKCKACNVTFAGGAYVPLTEAFITARNNVKRLAEI